MNKSTLFLLYILSTSAFSCSAMEILEYGKYKTQQYLSTLSNYAYSQEPMRAKTTKEKYREAVDAFNNNAELLKKDLGDKKTLWTMIDNLDPIKREIFFIVGVINHQDNNTITDSLRLLYINKTIERFNNTSKPFTVNEIEKYQKAITKIANFSISENLNTNLESSVTGLEEEFISKPKSESSPKELLQSSDLELEQDPELLELFQLKKEEILEKKRKSKEVLEKMILVAKQQKIQANQLTKEKQLEEEILAKEKQLQQQKIEDAAQIAKEEERLKLEKIEQEKREEIELKAKHERIRASDLKQKQQLETERLAQLTKEKEFEQQKLLQEQFYLEKKRIEEKELKERIEQEKIFQTMLANERIKAETSKTQLATLEKLEQKLENNLQKQATMRRYMWAGIGLIGLTAAAIIYYYKLHTKYIPWLSRA